MRYTERLRTLREERSLTQESIAEVLTVSQRTYSDYESGRVRIPVQVIYAGPIPESKNIKYGIFNAQAGNRQEPFLPFCSAWLIGVCGNTNEPCRQVRKRAIFS